MDIGRLLKKRQLNVQEQNAVCAHRLMTIARAWRVNGVPVALVQFGQRQGIDWSATIVLDLQVDFPGMPSLHGMLLTQAERFIAFEIETDRAHRQVESVEKWEDVSAHQDYSTAKRGTGKGFAAIALHVRHELMLPLG
ncbi:hypothetical protein [Pseudomonas rubra]|uniref:Uncharacterized protein n=1 Tax=Pseudomonas rubra TaxID=2942627 RepID=A0ABT5PBQ4_9PSED|nr:hypothetical protein [Pseudomonas rubra]MDD1015468.1 hypothetical protein [Pseudomonas rubra]MDD1041282.1 hypothetical protein [Pseudomonas rubra]MDD1153631.1 hypothetical protein [Pseudomonas rubra]